MGHGKADLGESGSAFSFGAVRGRSWWRFPTSVAGSCTAAIEITACAGRRVRSGNSSCATAAVPFKSRCAVLARVIAARRCPRGLRHQAGRKKRLTLSGRFCACARRFRLAERRCNRRRSRVGARWPSRTRGRLVVGRTGADRCGSERGGPPQFSGHRDERARSRPRVAIEDRK